MVYLLEREKGRLVEEVERVEVEVERVVEVETVVEMMKEPLPMNGMRMIMVILLN